MFSFCQNIYGYVLGVHITCALYVLYSGEARVSQLSNQQKQRPKSFKLVIDNIDMMVKPCFMRLDSHHNQSLNYVNAYAVYSRINFTHLPDTHPDTCLNRPTENALLLLPSMDDDKSIQKLFATHVSWILFTHMKFFQTSFDGVIDWHVKHQYYKEMSTKSTVVSILTVAFKLMNIQ